MIMKCQKPFKSLDSVVFTTKNETEFIELGPVVQSIVSLTSSLRGRLVKCFTAL